MTFPYKAKYALYRIVCVYRNAVKRSCNYNIRLQNMKEIFYNPSFKRKKNRRTGH